MIRNEEGVEKRIKVRKKEGRKTKRDTDTYKKPSKKQSNERRKREKEEKDEGVRRKKKLAVCLF